MRMCTVYRHTPAHRDSTTTAVRPAFDVAPRATAHRGNLFLPPTRFEAGSEPSI
jgi:hypothetical protein